MRTHERAGLTALFVADGLALATWAARLPSVKSAHDLSDAGLAVVLFAVAVGALAAMPVAGAVVSRSSTRGATIVVPALFLVALAILGAAPSVPVLLAGAVLFGAGFGGLNVVLNALAIRLERRAGRPILSSFHGGFSAGGIAGAGLAALAALAGLGPAVNLVGVAALLGLVTTAGVVLMGDRIHVATERSAAPAARAPRGRLAAIGAIAFCCLLTEGAAADWSAVHLRDVGGASLGVAALGYFVFAVMMTAGRLSGDRLTMRLGPVTLGRAGGGLAAVALAAALLAGTTAAGLVAWAAVGAGMSVVVPLAFRAAGAATPTRPAAGVAAVSSIGWLGFVAGPPVIGLIAEVTSLRVGLVPVVAACLLIVALAGRLRAGGAAAAVTPGAPARQPVMSGRGPA